MIGACFCFWKAALDSAYADFGVLVVRFSSKDIWKMALEISELKIAS